MLTVDASVFAASLRQMEIHYADSFAFLDALRRQPEEIHCPTPAITETVAAIARTTADLVLIQQASVLIDSLPGMNLAPLDVNCARQAAQLAAVHRLRGADAVYVAVAAEFGATLITWDEEMLQRGAHAVTTQTPTDWLLANPPPSP